MKNILILGATSAIARETARLWAASGDGLFLVGRNEEQLELDLRDLKVRGASQVEYAVSDLANQSQHAALLEQIFQSYPSIDVVLIAYGFLGDQKIAEDNFDAAEKILSVNFVSVCSLLNALVPYFKKQKRGSIAVISSVAGDRGRKSNYIYGSAKGALSIYLQGLRNQLYSEGISVLTIKPGFVDTPMTKDFEKGPLFVKPEVIARGIIKAVEKRRNVVYLPWFWRWIMLVIKSIPECLFKRLSI